MRMRFKPYAGPELAACPFHMNDATRYKGRWRETFARPGQPLHLELGCGKGGFLARLASRNPDVNYIGVDITDKVLILAKRNIERIYAEQGLPIDNVKTLAHDIERIPTLLDKADRVERIYINFCNPWNKKANHKKHRLTHTRQLLLYRPFLADGAEIWFKCDDDDLFKDTLRYMAEAKKEFGLNTICEVISEAAIEAAAKYVDMLQIGARNMQNFELLKELGKLQTPVLLKRGLANTIEEFLMSAEYIMAGGNENVVLCERGIRTFETSMRNTLDISAVPMLKSKTHLPVVIDPSHAAGIAWMVEPLAMAAIAAGADGLMIEVHNDPPHAKSDGAQSLTPAQFDALMGKVKAASAFFGKAIN